MPLGGGCCNQRLSPEQSAGLLGTGPRACRPVSDGSSCRSSGAAALLRARVDMSCGGCGGCAVYRARRLERQRACRGQDAQTLPCPSPASLTSSPDHTTVAAQTHTPTALTSAAPWSGPRRRMSGAGLPASGGNSAAHHCRRQHFAAAAQPARRAPDLRTAGIDRSRGAALGTHSTALIEQYIWHISSVTTDTLLLLGSWALLLRRRPRVQLT